MENSFKNIKKELLVWIENSTDFETLSRLLEIKNSTAKTPDFSEEDDLNLKIDYDEQFAAGMSPDELLENIAAHLETLPEKE